MPFEGVHQLHACRQFPRLTKLSILFLLRHNRIQSAWVRIASSMRGLAKRVVFDRKSERQPSGQA